MVTLFFLAFMYYDKDLFLDQMPRVVATTLITFGVLADATIFAGLFFMDWDRITWFLEGM